MFPNQQGLNSSDAQKRLEDFGKNILPEAPPPSRILVFISQFRNPLVYVLLAAGLTTLAIGHVSDGIIIFVAVLLNTILGYFQEERANKALSALKNFVASEVVVIRDGKRKTVDSANIVPGDLIVLSQGSKVSADGVLIFANRLFFDEAIITGESVAVSKVQKGEVYMGTTVSAGQGIMKATATGKDTRIGKIAKQVQEKQDPTPLQSQLKKFSEKLVYLVLTLVFVVFVIGVYRGQNFSEMFTVSVALAVSSIPEGLLVSLTVVLAVGMQRILRRKGLVRKLSSAETLGGVTVICVDKTGTLTKGKMRVVAYDGKKGDLIKQVFLANDLDDPLVISAYEWAKGALEGDLRGYERLDSIPFSPKERYFASLNKWNKKSNMMFVNGAPDMLLKLSNLTDSEKVRTQKVIDDWAREGKRLIGFSRKLFDISKNKLTNDDIKEGLDWVGLVAFSDPIRDGVSEALLQAKKSGIRIIVVTGDYPKTSEYVLSEIGMPVKSSEIVTGEELGRMSLEELGERVKSVRLFARTTPDQKLMIVEALKNGGEIVAMMGDGVNDAPALHKADIGIVVEDASDTAKESADLVLLDSNFATILSAVEEGRGIFENIRKIILYLMSDAFGEIIIVLGAIFLKLPLPVTALQILWINLVSDGFPDLALTIDPKRKGIMDERPRPPKEQLMTRWMGTLIGAVSLASGLAAFGYFYYIYMLNSDIVLARSVAFATLGLNSLIYVFSVRSLTVPFWKNNLFGNKWLVLAVSVGLFLQILPFATSSLRGFFGVARLDFEHWATAGALAFLMFVVVEMFKLVYEIRFVRRLLG